MANMNDFDDLSPNIGGGGIFGGEALGALEQVTPKIAPDRSGYAFYAQCQGCGRSTRVEITWAELVIIANKRLPNGWIHDRERGGVYPPGRGRCCTAPMPLLLNNRECSKYVTAGIDAGIIPPDYPQRVMASIPR